MMFVMVFLAAVMLLAAMLGVHKYRHESLLHIGRVFGEARVDGRLRFRLGVLQQLVVVGIFGDGDHAIMGRLHFGVAFLRVIGSASLHGRLHAILDHGGFSTGLDIEHASVLQLHLLAACHVVGIGAHQNSQDG